MASKFVTLVGQFTGIMTEPDPPQKPDGIWGPTDPRPANPIAGFDPIHGTFPDRPPLGFWGPNDPRPANPIAGFDPIHGTFPERPTNPPSFPGQLPGSNAPGWVYAFVPGRGWGWVYVPVPPGTEGGPSVPPTTETTPNPT